MSEWADANRQHWPRCWDCWNLSPCCVCDRKRQAQVDQAELTGFKSIINGDVGTNGWTSELHYWPADHNDPRWKALQSQVNNLRSQLEESAAMSTHDIVAEAYRVLYDC